MARLSLGEAVEFAIGEAKDESEPE